MKVAYVVSMFPCWSETFILNELVNHRQEGLDLSIFSLKRCDESMVHEEARGFVADTVYPPGPAALILAHLRLLLSSPMVYLGLLARLLVLRVGAPLVKLKALAVFALAPPFVFAAREQGIGHLHAHFATYPALLAWIVAGFNRIPFSFTAHAHDIYVNHDLLPLVVPSCRRIVAISEFNRRFILDKVGEGYGDKISVIRCGIPLERLSYLERAGRDASRPLRILSIGRLSGIKGFRYLIEALRLLRQDGVEFCCDIVGDGPLKGELLQQLKDAGLEGRVRLVGARPAQEIPAYLERADLFVLACARDQVEGHDGIPVVFMEAMARGVPVVGTAISGIPELIRHGLTGFCAAAEDPVSLKGEIVNLLSDRSRLKEITRNARALIEQEFDIVGNSRELRALFLGKGR